jgi:hypothetical protein
MTKKRRTPIRDTEISYKRMLAVKQRINSDGTRRQELVSRNPFLEASRQPHERQIFRAPPPSLSESSG